MYVSVRLLHARTHLQESALQDILYWQRDIKTHRLHMCAHTLTHWGLGGVRCYIGECE